MSLNSYLLDVFHEEESIVKELLNIDNKVCMTNLTYEELDRQFREAAPLNNLDRECIMLTDGDPDTVFEALINNASNIISLHIDNNFLGINKWLVSKTIKYYEEKDINIKLQLDEQNGYSQYKNCPSLIVAFGFDEFAAGISELFDGQDVLVVSK